MVTKDGLREAHRRIMLVSHPDKGMSRKNLNNVRSFSHEAHSHFLSLCKAIAQYEFPSGSHMRSIDMRHCLGMRSINFFNSYLLTFMVKWQCGWKKRTSMENFRLS